jgi:hypothetical protein
MKRKPERPGQVGAGDTEQNQRLSPRDKRPNPPQPESVTDSGQTPTTDLRGQDQTQQALAVLGLLSCSSRPRLHEPQLL